MKQVIFAPSIPDDPLGLPHSMLLFLGNNLVQGLRWLIPAPKSGSLTNYTVCGDYNRVANDRRPSRHLRADRLDGATAPDGNDRQRPRPEAAPCPFLGLGRVGRRRPARARRLSAFLC